VPGPVYWIEAFAAQRGLRYTPDADERWLRAWEPYTTLKVPVRYEHALEATGGGGSITIARCVVDIPPVPHLPPGAAVRPTELGMWIAIVQDIRLTVKVATTSDFGGVFGEPLDLVTLPRRPTGDGPFDHVFASFAESNEDLHKGLTPSLRKLLLSWQIPVHAEIRPGGFILAPVSVTADDRGLTWMLGAVHMFGDKATKLVT
jgi:hypothetical protein